jgi:hypothetical protein
MKQENTKAGLTYYLTVTCEDETHGRGLRGHGFEPLAQKRNMKYAATSQSRN